MNGDKIKILKFINASDSTVNNHHIKERFPKMDNYFKYAEELFRDGYIEKHPNQFGYQLTASGRIALDLARQNRIDNIKYSITTTVAVAAFVKSFFF